MKPNKALSLRAIEDPLNHRRGIHHREGIRRYHEGRDTPCNRGHAFTSNSCLMFKPRLPEARTKVHEARRDHTPFSLKQKVRGKAIRSLA